MTETVTATPSPLPNRRARREDQLEFTVDRLGEDGEGLATDARVVAGVARRFRVHLPGALPGERVRALVTGSQRDEVHTVVLERLISSPDRVEPPCPHADGRISCGGCSFQTLAEPAQHAAKLDRLSRLLHLPAEKLRPVIGSPELFHYRNKLELSFGPSVAGAPVALGLRPRGFRHEVVALTGCYLLSEPASRLIPAIGAWAAAQGLEACRLDTGVGWLVTLTIREGKRTGDRLLELTTTQEPEVRCTAGLVPAAQVAAGFAAAALGLATTLDVPISGIVWSRRVAQRGSPTRIETTCLAGRPFLTETLHLPGGTLRFEIDPRAFFQPNTLATERVYAAVLAASGVLETRAHRALDLYCGTGTIALALAPFVDEAIGVELVPEAVENAKRNAVANNIANVRFLCGDAPAVIASAELGGAVDVVIVDPPRAGLAATAFPVLAQLGAPRLVYVSCNPVSLMRDLPELKKLGYVVEYAQPLDPFPHTPHVETVVALSRVASVLSAMSECDVTAS